ncbi:enoyl-CoA hydratase-related protein [Aliikangiella sp. IMCC44653]
MSEELILGSEHNGVYQIVFNRGDKLNALTDSMYASLIRHLKLAEEDDSVKVVVLMSNTKHFSAGNDLADFLETEFNLESNVVQFLIQLASMKKPLLAAVGGAAVGIGTTMLLHCDLVYAAADSKFSVPFIKLGLTPEGGSSQLLSYRCGQLKANEWLLTGRNVLAEEALQTGLVNQVYDSIEATWNECIATAESIAKNPLQVLLETKKLTHGATQHQIIELIKKEGTIFGQQLQTEQAKAAFAAFLGR